MTPEKKPAESARKPAQALSKRRTPEQEASLKDFHAKIGHALVDNLNRNALRHAQEDAAGKRKREG